MGLSIHESGDLMKSKLITALLAASAASFGLAPPSAMAQGTSTPVIDRAQQQISARIRQGMASGHITPSEARELFRRDREIELHEIRVKSNGNVTPQERQQLRTELDGLSAEVERMMANSAVVTGYGNASGNTPGIDSMEANLRARIDEGVRTGRINQREADRLHRRERDIARHEAAYKRDGVVTPQERRQLRDELSRLSNDVDRLVSNRPGGQLRNEPQG